MPPPPAETRATWVGKWLLAVLVPASGMALGSLPLEVLLAASVLAAIACALLWFEHDLPSSRGGRLLLLALAVLLVMTLLQVVPLPHGVSKMIAPANAEIWERALSPLHEPAPAWHALSVAPAGTRVELLRGFFYGALLLAALRVASMERGDEFLVRVVTFSAVLMALTALAHTAVNAEKVFGIYRPREIYAYPANRFSPLLNKNHLAAYLNIGVCVALGSLVSGRAMPRPLAASATLVLAATSVWQGSRGGMGALALGAPLAIALTFYAKRRFASGRIEVAILALCTCAAAVTVSLALSDVARDRLMSRELTKVYVARSSLELIGSSPFFGVGRGGFETVFSSVREGASYVTFTHPEDIFIQWFVEWGVPVSLVGMALIGWAMRPQLMLHAVRPAVGAWVAVITTVLHDLVDFHLEVPGVVALVVLCAAIVVSGRRSSRDAPARPPSTRWTMRPLGLALAAGSVLAIALSWQEIGHSLAEDRRALSAMAIDKKTPREQFEGAARASMLRYPGEPFFPLMTAVRAQLVDEGSVLPGVARALERSPRFGRAHLVLARSLGVARAPQARLEYRLAFEYDVELRSQILKEAVRLVVDSDSALELVPAGESGVEMLEGLVQAVAARLPSTATILDVEIERRAPTANGPLRRRIDAAAADATDQAVWCAAQACIKSGLSDADVLGAREPKDSATHILIARLRIANGEAMRAIDGLDKACEFVTDRAECQRTLVDLAFSTGQTRLGDAALDKVVRGGCGSSTECAELYAWAGGAEDQRGHFTRAVRLYKRVLEITPDREDLLQRIGELGDKSGIRADALEAYAMLQTRHPEDPQWPARIAELRRSAVPQRDPKGVPVMPPP